MTTTTATNPSMTGTFRDQQPARVSVVVAELIHHALFDIEAVAVIGDDG